MQSTNSEYVSPYFDLATCYVTFICWLENRTLYRLCRYLKYTGTSKKNQPVALLRCNEAQVALIAAFRSSALLGLVSLIFLLTIPIDSLWGSGQASLLANQAQ